MTRRRGLVLARLSVLLGITVAALLSTAVPAWAHPALVSSSPGAGYAVTDAPREIVLSFNERLVLPPGALKLTDGEGQRQTLRVSLDAAATTLRGVPQGVLPAGVYEVTYRVVGTDGDLIQGKYRFGVATPVGTSLVTAGGSGDPNQIQPPTAALRGLLFLGLSLGLGGIYLAWRVDTLTGGIPGSRPLVGTGSVVALVGVAGLLARLGPLDELPQRVGEPGATRLLAVEAALLLLATITARVRGRGVVPGALLLGVVLAEAARAHPRDAGGLGSAALLAVHLLAGAVWLGGLVHVLRLAVAWRAKRLAARVAVQTYARSALALVAVAIVTGTVNALTLLPSRTDWTGTAYGRVLLIKIGLLLAVLAIATAARLHMRSTWPAQHDPAVTAPRLPIGRAAHLELALLAAVVLAAAAVTTVTPAKLVPTASLLAAPVGPVLRTAERDGQVSVELVASQGRVEVRVDAPDDGHPLTVTATAAVIGEGGPETPLRLTTCGAQCWTAPVRWSMGDNVVAVDVDAGRWQAGRTDITVRWPIVPAPELLARVQSAMGARSAIDTFETVTSGFGVDVPSRSRRTGQEYLESQPWSDGGATDAVLVDVAGARTLMFALPSLGYHFAMRLDAADRVLSERIVTPDHLLIRLYSYPS